MSERSELELIRLSKLKDLCDRGFSFPNDVNVTCSTIEALKLQPTDPGASNDDVSRITLAGRIVQMRVMGKAAFAHILDHAGKIQFYIKQDVVGEHTFKEFKELDIGDIVEVRGHIFVTKTGETSLYAEHVRLLTKSLIPLPEKWHGLTDIESRYRYRYVDLISNPQVRDLFRTRASVIREIRRFLDDRGYTEVETPVLQHVAGGATARPFKTHHNSLGADMFLRIATELPLKKLVVGGMERVYEIGRIFRNEGISKKHNPEFTSIEFYQAYATFEDLMNLTEEMFVDLCKKVCGTLKIQYGEHEIDFTPPWPRISMKDSIYDVGGISRSINLDDLASIKSVASERRISLTDASDWGKCIEDLWGDLVEPKLVNPCFIIHHPFSISPLARKNAKDPRITDRFELIVAGMEMANAFSELNDPVDQRERFEAQAQRKAKGDEEASDVDEDFLRALEYGMPPTAGEGIGIDRLVMLLTNSHTIREVVLFPQLKSIDTRGEEHEGQ